MGVIHLHWKDCEIMQFEVKFKERKLIRTNQTNICNGKTNENCGMKLFND